MCRWKSLRWGNGSDSRLYHTLREKKQQTAAR
jgi:hypothetical protein